MEYYVVLPDGTKYGPASLALLNKWAEAGRVFPDTVVERTSDGARGPASLLPGLRLSPDSPPPVVSPPTTAPASETAAPPFIPAATAQPAGAGQVPATAAEKSLMRFQEEAMLGRFNWGACLLTWIWGLNHRAYWTLLTLFPWVVTILLGAVNGIMLRASNGQILLFPGYWAKWLLIGYAVVWIVMRGIFGMKGNRWAWKSGRYTTPKECEKGQRIWGWWGAGAAGGAQVAFLAFHFMLPTILRSQMQSGRTPDSPWLARPGAPPNSIRPGSPFEQRFPGSPSASDDPGLAQMRQDMERIRQRQRQQMDVMRRRQQQSMQEMRDRMRADMERMRGNMRNPGFPGR